MADEGRISVTVLGTGIMGAAMARNLAAAGHDVRAWNRTRARAERTPASRSPTLPRRPPTAPTPC